MIGNMILAISNEQTEVDNHHRIVQDRKGVHRRQIRITEVDRDLKHNRHCQIRTTEVNRLNPEDLIHEMAILNNGPVTKDKPQKEIHKIQGMATGSKEMSEIAQINSRLRHNRMVDLARSCHRHRIPRKAQWKSGKRRRRPECTRLLTNQR
jgi:hypothetical protein